MNHSRIKASVAALAVAALVGLSACGGGSDGLSRADEEALQAEAAAAEEARQAAEEARQAAEEAKRQAEEAQRQAEEEARQAELEQARAEAAAEEARRQRQAEEQARQAAEQQRQAEEEARQAAEAEQKRLQDEAEAAQRRLDAAAATRALAGTRTTGTSATLAATASYRAPATITTPTLGGTGSTSQAGKWLKTSHSQGSTAMRDTVEIFSDVEAPKRSPFATSAFNTASIINAQGMVVGGLDIVNADHGGLVASGSFPRSSGPPQPYKLVDRGPTQSEIDANPNDDIRGTGRDEVRYPNRYMTEVNGYFQGASGRFRCGDDAGTATCNVQNRGGTFFFGGDWEFVPSSGTVQILSDDAEYMWFGWWSRYTASSDSWAFQAKHGGTVALTDVSAATGTATYRGTAAGHYAINEPISGQSALGSFTAAAQLVADFDNNNVSGSITNFSNAPDWSVTLNSGDITGGTATQTTDGVTWSINGNPTDSGSWEAAFYSNLPSGQSAGVVPYGIAGTFQADYGSTGELIGAFGAHR